MQSKSFGEFGLIEKIKDMFSPLISGGMFGIGDDCAVIPISDSHSLVVTTDMLVENIHFLRNSISPFELGGKSLSVNLSDIAAMGATPIASFLSIAIPRNIDETWCDEFINGYKSVSERNATPLLGGDTTASGEGVVVNVCVIGKIESKNIKLRSDARLGQKICVSGNLGDSATGLRLLLGGEADHELVRLHHNPRAHLKEGILLAALNSVGAMMDVSDGIASDLLHILKASGVAATIELSKLPMSHLMREVCIKHKWDEKEIALCGGEDYVLLFTVDSEIEGDFHVIGEITQGEPKITWTENGKTIDKEYNGFSHNLASKSSES